MDDLISRELAVESVKNLYLDDDSMVENEDECNWMIDACIETLRELPSAQPEQRWIPCSERMPKEKDAGILKKLGTSKQSEYVLATVETRGERMTVTACTYDGEWDWIMKYAFPDYKIIAWMPLPEPYRGM